MGMVPHRLGVLAALRSVGEMSGVALNFAAHRHRRASSDLAYAPWRRIGTTGNPGFVNGYSHVSGYEVEFFRDGWGFVWLRGVAQRTAVLGDPYNQLMFTMPASLVAEQAGRFPLSWRAANFEAETTKPYSKPGEADVLANGEVRFLPTGSTPYPGADDYGPIEFVQLDGISWLAANAGAS